MVFGIEYGYLMVLNTVIYELPLYFYGMCYSQEMHEIKAVLTFNPKEILDIFSLNFPPEVCITGCQTYFVFHQ